jgi:hypothetical protein
MAAKSSLHRPPTPGPRLDVKFVVDTEGAREVPEPGTDVARPRVTADVGVVADPETREPAPIPQDRIAVRANESWIQNGRPDGTAERDWLQAEAELRAEYAFGARLVSPGQRGPARGTVRLNGNVRLVTRSEWLGAPTVDQDGRIERTVDLPAEVYDSIERSIAEGLIEGIVFLDTQRRVDWFLDR